MREVLPQSPLKPLPGTPSALPRQGRQERTRRRRADSIAQIFPHRRLIRTFSKNQYTNVTVLAPVCYCNIFSALFRPPAALTQAHGSRAAPHVPRLSLTASRTALTARGLWTFDPPPSSSRRCPPAARQAATSSVRVEVIFRIRTDGACSLAWLSLPQVQNLKRRCAARGGSRMGDVQPRMLSLWSRNRRLRTAYSN